jgi:hypothetical protein
MSLQSIEIYLLFIHSKYHSSNHTPLLFSSSSNPFPPPLSSLTPQPHPSKSQTLPHKLPLRKAQPPLTRPIRPILIYPRQQPTRQLLPYLREILSEGFCFLAIGRGVEHLFQFRQLALPHCVVKIWRCGGRGKRGGEGKYLVKRKSRIARNSKVIIKRNVLDFFLCFPTSSPCQHIHIHPTPPVLLPSPFPRTQTPK